jgi:hypothetical protein
MGGRGFLTMKWSRIGISAKGFALEHDSLVNPTQNPEEPLLITDLLITDYFHISAVKDAIEHGQY